VTRQLTFHRDHSIYTPQISSRSTTPPRARRDGSGSLDGRWWIRVRVQTIGDEVTLEAWLEVAPWDDVGPEA
jgi:hypothetical protein